MPFLARSDAICTCRTSGNISGDNRDCSNTEGSIFFAAAYAAALSRTADNAERPISNVGMDDVDIANDMRNSPQFMLSSLGRRLRGLHFRQLALIEPDEIDRVQQKRRESPLDDGAWYDLPRKREQKSPPLQPQHTAQNLLGDLC